MIPWLIQYFYTYAIYILIQILVDYVQIANNRCILRCDAHVRKTLIRGRLLTWSESEAVQGSLGVGANLNSNTCWKKYGNFIEKADNPIGTDRYIFFYSFSNP